MRRRPPHPGRWRPGGDRPITPFALYVPSLLERLGLAEVTHDARNNQMRAKQVTEQ
jgi:hypothetical protein